LAEEAKGSGSAGAIWEATLATFSAKLVIAGTFIVPVLARPLDEAIVISVIWGLLLLTGLSVFVARAQAIPAWRVVGEHLFIALCVVAITHVVGDWFQGLTEAE